jgi:hypothetical protein
LLLLQSKLVVPATASVPKRGIFAALACANVAAHAIGHFDGQNAMRAMRTIAYGTATDRQQREILKSSEFGPTRNRLELLGDPRAQAPKR